MKRSELTVGAELYYAKPYEWARSIEGDKAVVLAVEPHVRVRHSLSHQGDRFAPTNGRGGVLVEMTTGNGYVRKNVVQLGHLRGPYAETLAEVKAQAEERRKAERNQILAEVKAQAEERRKAEREAQTQRDARRQARNAAMTWARELGFVVRESHSGDTVQLSVVDLERLLDCWAAHVTPKA